MSGSPRAFLIEPPEGPRLSARVHDPDGPPHGAVVMCHPHPEFGGSMESTVVRLACEAFAAVGLVALRFDFRGVGGSLGTSTAGPDEWEDAAAACDALCAEAAGIPLAIAGYSFGAWVAAHHAARDPRVRALGLVAPAPWSGGERAAPADGLLAGRPCVLVAPGRDHLQSPQEARAAVVALGGGHVHVLAGADHLLHGYAEDAAKVLARFLGDALADA